MPLLLNSVQMAKLVAVPVQHVRSDEHGRVRRAIFEWAPSAVDPGYTSTDTMNLCKLPPGARVCGGRMWWEANTATATFAVGIAGATTKYSAALVITNVSVASTIAGVQSGVDLGGAAGGGTIAAPVMGEVQASAVTIIGTVGVAALAVSKRIFGYVDYLGVE